MVTAHQMVTLGDTNTGVERAKVMALMGVKDSGKVTDIILGQVTMAMVVTARPCLVVTMVVECTGP